MFGNVLARSKDPVYSCGLYLDKKAGSCSHIDGILCDFPDCSLLAEYRKHKLGSTQELDMKNQSDTPPLQ